jgi:hypothetical protein
VAGGGQYTLSGTPTGAANSYPLPAGIVRERSFDGTGDGAYNYYVQSSGVDSTTSSYTENVYRTNLGSPTAGTATGCGSAGGTPSR